jgi:hypothetical protein
MAISIKIVHIFNLAVFYSILANKPSPQLPQSWFILKNVPCPVLYCPYWDVAYTFVKIIRILAHLVYNMETLTTIFIMGTTMCTVKGKYKYF